jgi:DNA-binding MarR family transcriptional regulator
VPEDQQHTGDAMAIMALLRELSVETDRYVERFGHSHGLHRTDLNALAVILEATRRGEAVTAGDLGARLNLSSPATSALLDRLGRAGHVVRARSTVDRRRVELRMTESAAEVGRALFAPLGRRVGAVIEALAPEQRDVVARFLEDVVAATVAARSDSVAVPAGPDQPGSVSPPIGASTSPV